MQSRILSRAMALAAVALLLSTTGVWADQLLADADALVTAEPHGNGATANQQIGTTAVYDLSALVKNTAGGGQGGNDVFPGTVTVAISRSGGWLATPAGSPSSWDFTAYETPQSGTIRVTVPCDVLDGQTATMTAALAAGASTNGKTLSPSSAMLSYVITATGPADASCDPGPTDTDGDGIADGNDNCPAVENADQSDADEDNLGDVCDDNSYAPVVGSEAADANGVEGDTLTTSGAFTDEDANDSLTLSADNAVGVFIDNGDGTWSWSYAPTDDVSPATIVVTASDGEHAQAADSFDYSAANVAPTLSALAVTDGTAPACIDGNGVGLAFVWTDPGSADTFTGFIDWGDGSADDSIASSPVSASHTYLAGWYTILVSVSDDDGGADSATGSVSLLYNASGVLQPVNNTQAHQDPSIFKYGSTIPVKIQVTDCHGVNVPGLAPTISVQKLAGTTPSGIDESILSTSAADYGTTMRWSDPLYIYNLATKSLADSTAKYRISISGPFAPVTADFGAKAK